jgi:hypothetical protein
MQAACSSWAARAHGWLGCLLLRSLARLAPHHLRSTTTLLRAWVGLVVLLHSPPGESNESAAAAPNYISSMHEPERDDEEYIQGSTPASSFLPCFSAVGQSTAVTDAMHASMHAPAVTAGELALARSCSTAVSTYGPGGGDS